MARLIEFGTEAKDLVARDAIAFDAMVHGQAVRCVVPAEALTHMFGCSYPVAVAVFEAHRGLIQVVARRMIERGAVKGGELMIRAADICIGGAEFAN